MKRSAFIKAVLRQPVRSLLMLLLIGAITYGITSHVVEYIAVLNVTKQLEKYYRPIGKLDNENYDVTPGRELVSKSPYVELEDVRRSCSGVLEGLYNADIDGLFGHVYESYVNDVIFYGVLQDKKYVVQDKRYLVETGKNINEVTIETKEVGEYQLSFKVNKVEAGYPDYLTEGKLIYVNYVPTVEGELEEEYAQPAAERPGRRRWDRAATTRYSPYSHQPHGRLGRSSPARAPRKGATGRRIPKCP
jgi:hypothetical protein